MAILMHYEKRFRKEPSESFLNYSDIINDDEIDRLSSDMFERKLARKTSKRVSRIKKSSPHLMTFYDGISRSC